MHLPAGNVRGRFSTPGRVTQKHILLAKSFFFFPSHPLYVFLHILFVLLRKVISKHHWRSFVLVHHYAC